MHFFCKNPLQKADGEMLVEFSVSNFRSIADRVTFSLAASASSSKRNDIAFNTENSLAPSVLKSAVIFGANASGKSSLIEAMMFFRNFVVSSSRKNSAGDRINIENNIICKDYRNEPSEFEATFTYDGELFVYGFRLDSEKVYEEWLFARHSKPASRTRSIFHRSLCENGLDYVWDINEGQLPGPRETWKEATRENALFLTVAVQLNSEALEKPYLWIKDFFHIIPSHARLDNSFTASLLETRENNSRINKLFSSLDLKIDGFRVEKRKRQIPEDFSEFFATKFVEKIKEEIEGEYDYHVFAKHTGDDGENVEISLSDESDGTQAIFGLAGPVLDVLDHGYTMVIDELSNSLHPLALKALVEIFHDSALNKRGAQLVFTSHETSVISKKLMHRDQIWLVDREGNGSSRLTPLSDFNVRDVLAFEKAYLGGKFGALPNISKVNIFGSNDASKKR